MLASVRERLRRFGTHVGGISAVEFAMILPLLLLLYIGSVEVGEGYSAKRKVTRVSSAVNDLVTQARTISDDEMNNILAVSATIVAPHSADDLEIIVTGVKIDNRGRATAAWSDALNATPYQEGASVSIPQTLQRPNSFLIATDVVYHYTPVIGYVLTGTFDLRERFYLRPRQSTEITRVP